MRPGRQLRLDAAAIGAERMTEGDQQLTGRQVTPRSASSTPVERRAPDASQPRADPIHLAAGAKAGGRRQQRQHRHEQPEAVADGRRGRRRGRASPTSGPRSRPGWRTAAGASPRSVPRRSAAGRARSRRHRPDSTGGRSGGRSRAAAPAGRAAATSRSATATSETMPTVAWLKRGARASMTSRSRYGWAVLVRAGMGSGTRWVGAPSVKGRVENVAGRRCREAGGS